MVDLQAPKGRKIEDAGLDACEAGGRQFARRREHDLNLLPVDGRYGLLRRREARRHLRAAAGEEGGPSSSNKY